MSKLITSDKFVKSGGTNLQFLKADGSIDSNTYLTSATESQTLSWVSGTGMLSISNGNSISLDNRYLLLTGGTVSGVTTFSSNVTFDSTITSNSIQTRDKIRVWTDGNYTIGMSSGYTYGGLVNDYAMSFQMNNADTRGFWWGDSSHTNSQGAMALTTNGLLTVANGLRVGYGESDTTVPTINTLDVKGGIKTSDGTNGVTMAYNTTSKTLDFIFN